MTANRRGASLGTLPGVMRGPCGAALPDRRAAIASCPLDLIPRPDMSLAGIAGRGRGSAHRPARP